MLHGGGRWATSLDNRATVALFQTLAYVTKARVDHATRPGRSSGEEESEHSENSSTAVARGKVGEWGGSSFTEVALCSV